jgi:hypothetical protein
LLKLGISENDIRAEGGKALAEALQDNQVITELNIANNSLCMNTNYDFEISGVASLADVISGMGAISQFTFSGDVRGSTPVTMEISMTEAYFRAKGLGVSGAIMVAAFLPK